MNNVIKAISIIIKNASDDDKTYLKMQINEYQTRYFRSWSSLMRFPFAKKLLTAVIEAL